MTRPEERTNTARCAADIVAAARRFVATAQAHGYVDGLQHSSAPLDQVALTLMDAVQTFEYYAVRDSGLDARRGQDSLFE